MCSREGKNNMESAILVIVIINLILLVFLDLGTVRVLQAFKQLLEKLDE